MKKWTYYYGLVCEVELHFNNGSVTGYTSRFNCGVTIDPPVPLAEFLATGLYHDTEKDAVEETIARMRKNLEETEVIKQYLISSASVIDRSTIPGIKTTILQLGKRLSELTDGP